MSENVGKISYLVEIDTKNFKAQLSEVDSNLKSAANSTSQHADKFGEAWKGAIIGVAAALTNQLVNVVSSTVGDMTDLYDASIKFPKVLQTMGASTDYASKSFKDLKDYADNTIYSLDDMTNTFGSLYGITGKSTGELVSALGGISTLGTDASQAMKSWSLQLTQMVAKPTVAWQDFRILLEQNPAAIAKIAQAMGKTTESVIKGVQDGTVKTSEFLDAMKKVGNDPALQKAATSSDTFKNSMGQLRASIASTGAQLLQTFGPTVLAALNGLATAISGSIGFITTYGEALKQVGIVMAILLLPQIAILIASTVTAGVTALIAGAQMAAGWLLALGPIGLIIAAVAAAAALIIMNFDRIKQFAVGAWNAISSFAAGSLNTIKAIWGGIGSWFSGLGGQLVGAGKSMIDGLVKGISNGKDAVVNKIKEIASNSLQAIKDFFGIKSPSRVMAQMGQYMMSGWSIGMDNSADLAISSAQRASNGILGTFDNLTSPTLGVSANGSLGGSVGSRTANINNTYIVNNQADAEIISRKQAYAMGAV